jgi:hypothetical protein
LKIRSQRLVPRNRQLNARISKIAEQRLHRSADYEVGYGRPPKQHQFKKGQLGNRKGRPKNQKQFVALLAEALNETIAVQEGGQRKRIRKIDAAAKQIANRAASGDHRAMKLLIELAKSPEWKETTYQQVESPRERLMARVDELSKRMAEEAAKREVN